MRPEREVVREAARVFRFLLDPDFSLRRAGTDGAMHARPAWHVWARDHRRGRTVQVADEVVHAWLERGWLAEGPPGCARLGDAGRRWCLRESICSAGDAGGSDADRRVRSRVVDDEGGNPVLVRVNHRESPLAWLHHRRGRNGKPIIDGAQFGAGEMLRQDFEAARLRQSVTARWDIAAPARSGRGRRDRGERDLAPHALDARRRFYRAVDDLGPELARVAVDTCCFLRGLEATETANGWPQRSAKVVLQIALTRLARHYGLDRAVTNAE